MCALNREAPSSPGAPDRYVNREISWIQFNTRVLAEAEDAGNPLLERLKFLAIFESNLDEFYMVRVSGLIEQEASGITDLTPDGLNATQQLALIAEEVRPLRKRASDLWSNELLPELRRAGIELAGEDDPRLQSPEARAYFESSVFPLCTPLLMDPTPKFPFISNRSLNLAVWLEDEGEDRLARVKVPPNLPRLVPCPGHPHVLMFLDALIGLNLDLLFPGVDVKGYYRFRVIRDADVEVREIEAADLITAVERSLQLRRFGDPVLLEYEATMPERWLDALKRQLALEESDTLPVTGLVGYECLFELQRLDRPRLKYAPVHPYAHSELAEWESLFPSIRQSDVLVHHPYDSFRSVERFVASAAEDPAVVGIKMTLYRVGAESPIVQSLLTAAEAGKQVAAMVELKARFDESNNLVWSRALERAGVHVTYGFRDMKVHCKLCLVVRQEPGGFRTYVHIGTGNYNPETALVYTDIGLFTCSEDVCKDVTEMFNFLTGYSKQSEYRRLLVAPLDLREKVIERIEREIRHQQGSGHGRIIFKLNSLVDPEVIDALYEASQAGVEVKLAVRGICCLRPGVQGMSENIEVVSIVGRFLEHSRVYLFDNGGEPEAFIGSADMMRRNLDRRIEVLVPVNEPHHVRYLLDTVLLPHFDPRCRSWRMDAEGHYERAPREAALFELQDRLLDSPATQVLHDMPDAAASTD